MEKRSLSEETLQEIIRRIVAVARPEKIVPFGSDARGEQQSYSGKSEKSGVYWEDHCF